MSTPSASVAALVQVRDEDIPHAAALIEALRPQSEIVVIDVTTAGNLEFPGVRVVREPSRSRGLAWLAGLSATRAEWLLCLQPGATPSSDRVERQLEFALQHPEAELITSDLALVGKSERYLAVDLTLPAPPAYWLSGALLRSSALARIDTTCFAPVELALLERVRAEGAVLHLPQALTTVDLDTWELASEEAEHDARLLHLSRGARVDGPLVTVLLACHNRMDVLPKCLAGFARQLVPPGTLEIVVCDDGSTDGTLEFLSGLDLAVPLRFTTGQNTGACAARNRGLDLVRGDLVLFVNDDTVPAPDLVQRHLEAHRSLGARKVAVLGTFEQPDEAMEVALTRVLEHGPFVFGYPGLVPGQELGGSYFYTCNVSLPAEGLREVGRFDEDFPWYTEDTEFGARLEQCGYRIHYRPEARAWHHHPPTVDALSRRQPAVARAHVRLFSKHPHLLEGQQISLSAGAIRASHREPRKFLQDYKSALQTLAGVNLARIERATEAGAAAVSRTIEDGLTAITGKLNTLWWLQGIEEGLVESGLRGFADLVAREPLCVPNLDAPLVLLHTCCEEPGAWVAAAEAWMDGAGVDDSEDAVLAVIADPVRGLNSEAIEEVLGALIQRCLARGRSPRPTLVLDGVEDDRTRVRLLAGAAGWLRTGARRDEGDRGLALSTRASEIDCLRGNLSVHALPIADACGKRLLGWPEWNSSQALAHLGRELVPLLSASTAGVVLLHDAELDGPIDAASELLSDAWRDVLPESFRGRVVVQAVQAAGAQWTGIAGFVDVAFCAGADSHRRDLLGQCGLERIESAVELETWLQRPGSEAQVAHIDASALAPAEPHAGGGEALSRKSTSEQICHA